MDNEQANGNGQNTKRVDMNWIRTRDAFGLGSTVPESVIWERAYEGLTMEEIMILAKIQ